MIEALNKVWAFLAGVAVGGYAVYDVVVASAVLTGI